MTEVNISTVKNTVEVVDNVNNVIEVNVGTNNVAEVSVAGPQGPAFTTSGTTLDDSNKINDSIVYFDSTSGTFKADATTTKLSLVNGGNF